jgi:hypothetical protein
LPGDYVDQLTYFAYCFAYFAVWVRQKQLSKLSSWYGGYIDLNQVPQDDEQSALPAKLQRAYNRKSIMDRWKKQGYLINYDCTIALFPLKGPSC